MALTSNLICEKTKIRERILEFLRRKKEYASGEEISHYLNISRQSLWQHINDLRDSGYDIAAVPHLGYRMESWPDRIFPFEVEEGLATKFVGRNIHYLERCSSTMDIAMQMACDNPAEGTVVLAEAQTKGRGRLGRHWVSPKYKGVYFTLILKPEVPPGQSAVLTFLAAVAVCEAVKSVTGIAAAIKWPNDILINNKKLAGILTEIEAEPDRVHFVFIGIGLNVNNDAKELLKGAISLKVAGGNQRKFSRIGILQEIMLRIEDNYILFQKKGAATILDKWKKLNITLGKRVRIISAKDHSEGVALNINADGGLLVRVDSGKIRKFMSGDVVHLR
jgi:BirA family transcriptional regulator, biotin operon repressor / biotin---[acetyl-CoA-carboxylase] ligase